LAFQLHRNYPYQFEFQSKLKSEPKVLLSTALNLVGGWSADEPQLVRRRASADPQTVCSASEDERVQSVFYFISAVVQQLLRITSFLDTGNSVGNNKALV